MTTDEAVAALARVLSDSLNAIGVEALSRRTPRSRRRQRRSPEPRSSGANRSASRLPTRRRSASRSRFGTRSRWADDDGHSAGRGGRPEDP